MRLVILQPSIVLQWQQNMLILNGLWMFQSLGTRWGYLLLCRHLRELAAGASGAPICLKLSPVLPFRCLLLLVLAGFDEQWHCIDTFIFSSLPLLVSCGCTLWVSCPSSRGVPDHFVCPHMAAAPSLPWTFFNSRMHFLRCRGQNRMQDALLFYIATSLSTTLSVPFLMIRNALLPFCCCCWLLPLLELMISEKTVSSDSDFLLQLELQKV